MKSFPITREVEAEIAELNTVMVRSLNKDSLTPDDIRRLYLFTSLLNRFARFGREGVCPSVLHHGPGHQSELNCRLPLDHDGHHEGEDAKWRGLVASTDYFDMLPDLDDDDA